MSDHQHSDDSGNLQFPWKLHLVLNDAEEDEEYRHLVSWLPGGTSFMVHGKQKFCDMIMPKYFQSTKYKSFQRNLNLWGFHTETREPNKGAIYHPYFLRGQPEKCQFMKRVRIKKASTAAALHSSPIPSPDMGAADRSQSSAQSQRVLLATGTPPPSFLPPIFGAGEQGGEAAIHQAASSILLSAANTRRHDLLPAHQHQHMPVAEDWCFKRSPESSLPRGGLRTNNALSQTTPSISTLLCAPTTGNTSLLGGIYQHYPRTALTSQHLLAASSLPPPQSRTPDASILHHHVFQQHRLLMLLNPPDSTLLASLSTTRRRLAIEKRIVEEQLRTSDGDTTSLDHTNLGEAPSSSQESSVAVVSDGINTPGEMGGRALLESRGEDEKASLVWPTRTRFKKE